jgi:hypothetical protein
MMCGFTTCPACGDTVPEAGSHHCPSARLHRDGVLRSDGARFRVGDEVKVPDRDGGVIACEIERFHQLADAEPVFATVRVLGHWQRHEVDLDQLGATA